MHCHKKANDMPSQDVTSIWIHSFMLFQYNRLPTAKERLCGKSPSHFENSNSTKQTAAAEEEEEEAECVL